MRLNTTLYSRFYKFLLFSCKTFMEIFYDCPILNVIKTAPGHNEYKYAWNIVMQFTRNDTSARNNYTTRREIEIVGTWQ